MMGDRMMMTIDDESRLARDPSSSTEQNNADMLEYA